MTQDDPLDGFLGAYLDQQEAEGEAASTEELRPGEWRNLWTWVEVSEGEVLPASLELLGRARELADELGTRNCAVVYGHRLGTLPQRLGAFGADRVYVLDHQSFADYEHEMARSALVEHVKEHRPEVILFPATIQGRNLAAQLGAALDTGVVPNCNALSLDATERLVVGQQTRYLERMLVDIVVPIDRPQLFTVTPGSFRKPAVQEGRTAHVVELGLESTPSPRVRVTKPASSRERGVEHYDAVVAGGLGVASKEGFDLVHQLGRALGAYVGATRGAVACGWAEADQLLSVTRHRLRPRLYLACGVVGEYDHTKAIEDAEFVVSLTHNAELPMSEQADLVAVGDPARVLAKTLEHLTKAKNDRVTPDP